MSKELWVAITSLPPMSHIGFPGVVAQSHRCESCLCRVRDGTRQREAMKDRGKGENQLQQDERSIHFTLNTCLLTAAFTYRSPATFLVRRASQMSVQAARAPCRTLGPQIYETLSQASLPNSCSHAPTKADVSSIFKTFSSQYIGTFKAGYTMLRIGFGASHSQVS